MARQLVYSVYRSTPVAAGNDNLAAYGGYYVFLAFALERATVDCARLHHLVYFGRMSYRACNDFSVGLVGRCRFGSAYFVDVCGEVGSRNGYAFAVVGVNMDVNFSVVVQFQVARFEAYELPSGVQ